MRFLGGAERIKVLYYRFFSLRPMVISSMIVLNVQPLIAGLIIVIQVMVSPIVFIKEILMAILMVLIEQV